MSIHFVLGLGDEGYEKVQTCDEARRKAESYARDKKNANYDHVEYAHLPDYENKAWVIRAFIYLDFEKGTYIEETLFVREISYDDCNGGSGGDSAVFVYDPKEYGDNGWHDEWNGDASSIDWKQYIELFAQFTLMVILGALFVIVASRSGAPVCSGMSIIIPIGSSFLLS